MGEAIFWVQVTVQITQLPGGADNAIAQASMLALGGKAEQAEALLLDKAQPEDAVAMYLAAGEHLAAISANPSAFWSDALAHKDVWWRRSVDCG